MPADQTVLSDLADHELPTYPEVSTETSVPEPPPSVAAPPAPPAPTWPAFAASPMPSAPVASPVVPLPEPLAKDPHAQLIALAALASAIAGGPRGAFAGVPLGLAQGLTNLDQQNFTRYQREQQLADRRAQVAAQQQRVEDERTQLRAKYLNTIQQQLPTYETKADYDRYVDSAGTSLQYAGFRDLGPNQLRVMFPYRAPTAQQMASKAFATWLKVPQNARLLDEDPARAMTAVIPVDLNGDGVPEHVALSQLATLAGQPFATDEQGKLLVTPKGASSASEFQTAYQNALAKFRAENGREPSADEKQALIQGASEIAKGAGGSEFDRYVARLEQERGKKLTAREYAAERRRFTQTANAGPDQGQLQQQARDAARSAVWQKTPPEYMSQVARRLRAAGLEPEIEFGKARQDAINFGRSLLPADARLDTSPEQLFEMGRQALLGQFQPSAAPTSTPAPSPVTPRPAASALAKTMTHAELRAVAQRLGISEAQAEAQAKARGYVVQ